VVKIASSYARRRTGAADAPGRDRQFCTQLRSMVAERRQGDAALKLTAGLYMVASISRHCVDSGS